MCGVVCGTGVVVVGGSVEVMALAACSSAMRLEACIVASRLSYECLCGDLSQSVASWRGVPMLLMTMQRLVAMRARDLSRAIL